MSYETNPYERALSRLQNNNKIQNLEAKKISSCDQKAVTSLRLNLFQQSLLETSEAVVNIELKRQDGRFVAMATRDLQTLNLKFDQAMFNSLVFT